MSGPPPTFTKAVVIGLDGADWRLLTPWLAQGELPTLARLVAEGSSGPLRSTIRPESSVAWTSFATGVNPGKHGIFGFVAHQPGSYNFRLANGSHIGAPRFWHRLGQAGRRVGLLNIPFTYPPGPVNGVLISGMLTPGTHVPFAYPPGLQAEVLTRFPNYQFDPSETMHDKAALLASVAHCTDQQRAAALWLLREQAWDFFTVVFTGPDRMQHLFWADMDSRHPQHDPASPYATALLDHYRALDGAVAEIVAAFPAGTLLLVMSDHGFNGFARRFYVNRWLHAQGLLAVRPGREAASPMVGVLNRLRGVPGLARLKRRLLPDSWGPAQMRANLLSQAIDWPRTRAYFAPDGGLRLNVQGREPQGVVPAGAAYEALRQELHQALLALTDPLTGQRVLAEVHRPEALYHGPYTALAPDLIPEPVRQAADPAHNVMLDGALAGGTLLFDSSAPYAGNHAPDGILIAWGAGARPGVQHAGAHIMDLAPTLLAVLGVDIPAGMDGQVLLDWFRPGAVPAPRYDTTLPDEAAPVAQAFANDDESLVADRLRDLGYLE